VAGQTINEKAGEDAARNVAKPTEADHCAEIGLLAGDLVGERDRGGPQDAALQAPAEGANAVDTYAVKAPALSFRNWAFCRGWCGVTAL
jgi:hypothetical protein